MSMLAVNDQTAGDRDAEVLAELSEAVQRYVRRMVPEHLRDEVESDALYGAWQYLSKGGDCYGVDGLARRIVHHRLRDAFRRQYRRPEVSVPSDELPEETSAHDVLDEDPADGGWLPHNQFAADLLDVAAEAIEAAPGAMAKMAERRAALSQYYGVHMHEDVTPRTIGTVRAACRRRGISLGALIARWPEFASDQSLLRHARRLMSEECWHAAHVLSRGSVTLGARIFRTLSMGAGDAQHAL